MTHGRAVGYCTVGITSVPDTLEVMQLCVGPKQGNVSPFQTGASFFRWVLQYVRHHKPDATTVKLTALRPAMPFYARMGFFKAPDGNATDLWLDLRTMGAAPPAVGFITKTDDAVVTAVVRRSDLADYASVPVTARAREIVFDSEGADYTVTAVTKDCAVVARAAVSADTVIGYDMPYASSAVHARVPRTYMLDFLRSKGVTRWGAANMADLSAADLQRHGMVV